MDGQTRPLDAAVLNGMNRTALILHAWEALQKRSRNVPSPGMIEGVEKV